MAGMPLEGIRITDIGTALAIPVATKFLADYGAEVIKVESFSHLDSARVGPYTDNEIGEKYWERGVPYMTANANKLDIALDLNKPRGKEIFKELVRRSDVVTENFPPRVMKNFGLDYPVLKEVKPDLIMISSSGYGQTGPWMNYGAYGWGLEPMSGISQVTGYQEGLPLRSSIPYNDYLGAMNAVVLIMAALEYRRNTGKGMYIDFSQYEVGVFAVGETILDYSMNQRVQTRMGNRHPSMAPHGCYRCSGNDKWVVIAVSSDEEWQALCQAMGNPAWAKDEKFADALSRWKNQDELDRLIEEWTTTQDHYEVMRVLQAAGVPAGAVLNGKEQALDPHLKERDYYWVHKHPVVGTRALAGPWSKLSKTPAIMRMPPPTLGQHNEQVLSELLGMSKEEIAELASEGIISTKPVGEAELPPGYMPVMPIALGMEAGLISEYDENYREILGLPQE